MVRWVLVAVTFADPLLYRCSPACAQCVTVMAHPNNPGVFFAATSGQITVHAVDTLEQLAMNNLKGE